MNEKFKEFLSADSVKQCEEILGIKIPWHRLLFRLSLKWWVSMRKSNSNIKPYILFESIYKGRF